MIDGPSLNEDIVHRAASALFRYVTNKDSTDSSSSSTNNKLKLFENKRDAILIVVSSKQIHVIMHIT